MDWLLEHWRWDWPLVASLLVFSARAAFTDLRVGRIPNRLLSVLLFVVVLWLVALVFLVTAAPELMGLIRPTGSLPDYVLTVARNGALAFLVGLSLWLGGLWAAGDAKLFPLLVLALPLRLYEHRYVDLWPAFVLFYNVVMVSLAVILGDLLLRGGRALRRRLREPPGAKAPRRPPWPARLAGTLRANARSWGGLLLVFMGVFIFVKALRSVMSEAIGLVVHLDQTLLYVVLFFLCHPLMRLVSRPRVLVAVAIIDMALVGLALSGLVEDLTLGSLLSMSLVSVGVIVFRLLYDSYQQRMDFIELDIEALRPRMLVAEHLRTALQNDKAYFAAQQVELGALLPDGLKEEQVPLVQRWLRERLPGQLVPVQKTLPMAPSLFLGLLLTIVLGDYVIDIGG